MDKMLGQVIYDMSIHLHSSSIGQQEQIKVWKTQTLTKLKHTVLVLEFHAPTHSMTRSKFGGIWYFFSAALLPNSTGQVQPWV